LDLVLAIHALTGVVLARAQQLELRLPVAQHVRRNPGELGHLPDTEEELVRDRRADRCPHPVPSLLAPQAPWLTCALRPFDGLNVRTRRAVISISSPVCGLRPLREDFRRSRKCPNPTIFTSLPCSKARIMVSNTDSTTAADCRLERPCAATELMRSFLVSAITPLALTTCSPIADDDALDPLRLKRGEGLLSLTAGFVRADPHHPEGGRPDLLLEPDGHALGPQPVRRLDRGAQRDHAGGGRPRVRRLDGEPERAHLVEDDLRHGARPLGGRDEDPIENPALLEDDGGGGEALTAEPLDEPIRVPVVEEGADLDPVERTSGRGGRWA